MTETTQQSVQHWFDALPAEQGRQLATLRRLVLASSADMVETLKWSQPCYSLNSLVCYLQTARAHVSIGFQQGAALADPEGLLQGSGRMMRHVRIPLDSEIKESHISALLHGAIEHDKKSA